MSAEELSLSVPVSRRLAVRSSRIRFIFLLGLLDAFGPLGIDMYLPAFPKIEQELHAGNGVMQLTLSLFLAGLAVGQLICGPISDRFGRRIPLLYGCVAFGISSIICAFTYSIESLILARFMMGLAGATGMVIARAVVRDCFEETESARIYSMLMLVIGVAPIISPTVGSWLMELGSWRLIFWAMAIFGCVCGAAVAIDLPETHPRPKRRQDSLGSISRAYFKMLFDLRFVGYAVPVSLALGELFAYIASAPSLFMEIYELSTQSFSLAFATNAVGLIGSAQVNRWLVVRFQSHVVLRTAACVNALFSMLLLFLAWTGWGGFPAFFLVIFIVLSSVGIILPNGAAAVMAPFPRQAGAASALMGMLQFATGATTGALVGILSDGSSRPMVTTMATCAVLSVPILYAAKWQNR